MPRVPIVEQQVAPTVSQAPRADAVNLMPLAQAQSELARSVTSTAVDIRQEEIDKIETQDLFEGRRQLNAWEAQRIYDPTKGAMSAKGRQAFDLPKALDDEFRAISAEIEKGMKTERAKQSFRQLAEQRRAGINEWANKHEYEERERFYLEQYGADIESSKERAATSLDLGTVEVELSVQRQRTVDMLTRQGKSPEAIKQQIERDATDTHGRVIKSLMANSRDIEAEKYYASVRDQMDDSARVILDTQVAENSRDAKAMRFSDALSAKFYSPLSTAKSSGDIMSEAEAVEAAKKEAGDDAKLRARMVDAARFEWSLHERRIKDERDKSVEEGARLAGSGASLSKIKETLGAQWLDMTPPQRAAIQNEVMRKLGENEPNMNDSDGRGWKEYTAFKSLDPKQVSKLTMADLLTNYRPYLDDQHYSSIVNEWSTIQDAFKSGRGTKDPELSNLLSFEQDVESVALAVGLVPKDKTIGRLTGDEVIQYNSFRDSAAKAILEEERATGKKVQPDRRREIIESQSLRFRSARVDVSWGKDPKVRINQMTPQQRQSGYFERDQIPVPEYNAIENSLRSNKYDVNAMKIQRISYWRAQAMIAQSDRNQVAYDQAHAMIEAIAKE